MSVYIFSERIPKLPLRYPSLERRHRSRVGPLSGLWKDAERAVLESSVLGRPRAPASDVSGSRELFSVRRTGGATDPGRDPVGRIMFSDPGSPITDRIKQSARPG